MDSFEPLLDLELVRTLAVIVDTGGFTEAAKRLHRTQSAVSMQVKRLENSLGARLLHRNRARVVLTAEGETVLDYGRRMLALNDEVRQVLSAPAVEGIVRLGIPDDYAFYLPEVLARFAEMYPAVTLDVRCELSIDLIHELRGGNIDLAVVTRQPKTPGGHILRSEQLIWAAAPQIGAEHRKVLPLALFPEGYCVFRELTLESLRAAECAWRIAYTSRSLDGLLSAVSAGLAVTVITRSMLREGLREIEPEGPAGLPPLPQVEIALHRSPGRPSEPTQKLTDLILENLCQG